MRLYGSFGLEAEAGMVSLLYDGDVTSVMLYCATSWSVQSGWKSYLVMFSIRATFEAVHNCHGMQPRSGLVWSV